MLRKEREEILLCKANIEKESQELLVSIINDDCKVKRYLNPYLEKETMRCVSVNAERSPPAPQSQSRNGEGKEVSSLLSVCSERGKCYYT